MNSPSSRCTWPVSRRAFLVASGVGVAGLTFGRPMSAATDAVSPRRRPAKSTILFFLCGGASHVDTWDMKPNAPAEYRGPFQPIATSAPGVRLCEHLPLLAQQAHHLAVVNSVGGTVNTNDHHAGYYYNLTGHVPDQSFQTLGNNRTPLPTTGRSWARWSRPSAPHPELPNAITLPHKPSKAPYTRPGQFAARLGVEHDPLYVEGSIDEPLKFQAPALVLEGEHDAGQLAQRQAADPHDRRCTPGLRPARGVHTWQQQQERACRCCFRRKRPQRSTCHASRLALRAAIRRDDQRDEPAARPAAGRGRRAVRHRVLEGERKDRRQVQERGGWDTHGNNFDCLKEDLLPEFDRGFSALIEDLAQRGLLDETLVLVTSEMGRQPKIGDPRSGGQSGAGRDHWTHCLTDLLAGGGIRGGQTYGSSDRYGEYPADQPVTPADITKTVYHAMGIHDLDAFDNQGRPYNLLADGNAIVDLF